MNTSKVEKRQQNSLCADALSRASDAFAKANPKSSSQYQNALNVMPGGNTRTVLFYTPFPLTIVKGSGNRLWDADGHEYMDFLAEYTTAMYGHSNAVIRSAIDAALDGGINLAGHSALEVPLARLLCDRFASIDSIRFTNSGTESNLMAIAASIIHTQRKKIVVFKGGYHGAVFTFGSGHSSVNVPHEFLLAKYNDLDSVRRLFAEHASDIAAIIVEPMQAAAGCIAGEPEFLRGLRSMATEHKSLLIFDEVVTSRLSGSGRQGLLNIAPDLTTFGKYIGGGMTFGAFGGKAEVMAQFDPRNVNATPHAGTFNNNVLSMSAGFAGLSKLYTPEVSRKLNAKGDTLRERLNQICQAHSAEIQFIGVGSLMNLHAGTHAIRSVDDFSDNENSLKDLFFFHMIEHGFYIARRGFIVLTLVVTDDDIERFAGAVEVFVKRYEAIVHR